MAWSPPAADQDWTPPSGDADLDAEEFKRRVGRDPNPAELASFRANPENWAGASGDGTTVGGMVNAAATGINSGLSTQLAGFPVDVAEQVKELGKAAIGAPYQAITGRPAPDWLQPDTNPEAVVGSSAYLAAKARQAGAGALIDPSQPTPTNQLINQGASMLAPSILEGGAVAADRALTRTRAAGEPPPAPAAEPPPPPPVDGPVTAADLKASPEKLTPAPGAPAAPGPKPKITPKAGESAQQAAARQGIAPPAPEAPAAPAAPASPKDAIRQLNADSGGALPEVRTSALTGDHAETPVDAAHATIDDEPGKRMAGVIADENNALSTASQKVVDSAGGLAQGTESQALQLRGTIIDRALSGIRDWFDTNRKAMYASADAAAGGVPMTKFDNFNGVMSDPSKFTGAEGMQLHGDVQKMAQHFGLVGPDGFWKPTTGKNVEAFRQWVGEQYTPRTGRAIGALKDALDSDVAAHGGANFYQQARALRAKQAAMLENEKSIARLIPEKNPDGSTSTNRPVAVADLADHISNLPKEQFDHLINTLHDSAKLGNGELAENNAAAIRELKAHMAERLHEAGAGKPASPQRNAGRWSAPNYHKQLDAYALNMPSLFTDGEQARIRTVHDAGNALHMDKNYPATAALQRKLAAGETSIMRRNIGNAAEGLMSDLVPPGFNTLGELTGISQKIRDKITAVGNGKSVKARAAEVESRISKIGDDPNKPKPAPEPAPTAPPPEGGKPPFKFTGDPKQRGAVGHLNPPGVEHEYNESTGSHVVNSPNGSTYAVDHPNGRDIIMDTTNTVPEGRGAGEGFVRTKKLADAAIARGGELRSDNTVSADQQRVYSSLAKSGYKVELHPEARDEYTGGGTMMKVAPKGDAVFRVSKPVLGGVKQAGEVPGTKLGANPAFRRQAGAVSMGGDIYNRTPNKDVWSNERVQNDRTSAKDQRASDPYNSGGGNATPMGQRLAGRGQRGSISGEKTGPNIIERFKGQKVKPADETPLAGNPGGDAHPKFVWGEDKTPQTDAERLKHWDQLPKAGAEVNGLKVRDHVPNTSSISGSFDNYHVLSGVREMPFSAFENHVTPLAMPSRLKTLRDEISQNKEINPLIVGIDEEGPYIIEGAHRYDALLHLGKDKFPAKVVVGKFDKPKSKS